GNGYGPGDLWGCVGHWYSGDWYDSGAQNYIAETQGYLNNHISLQPDFPNDRPGGNRTYGCVGPESLPQGYAALLRGCAGQRARPVALSRVSFPRRRSRYRRR